MRKSWAQVVESLRATAGWVGIVMRSLVAGGTSMGINHLVVRSLYNFVTQTYCTSFSGA